MPAERYYTDQLTKESEEIVISGDEFHHVIRVMRCREGAVVEFVNGRGSLALACLRRVGKQEAVFSVEKLITQEKPMREIILVQGMPKLQRLEFIAEKGTELGMTALWIVPGDQSEKEGLSSHQKERLTAILIASMKQCGRLFLPTLEMRPKLSAWKEFPVRGYFGDIRSESPRFAQVLTEFQQNDSLYFFVGPESGFSEGEVKVMVEGGVKGVHLHENILRTDTAGIVALAIATTR